GGSIPCFQPHFNHAQAQDLARLQDSLADLLPVDEGPIGGVEVLDHNIVPTQKNLRVVAGDGGFGDLEGIVLSASDSGFVRFQIKSASGKTFAKKNKSRHRLEKRIQLSFREGQAKTRSALEPRKRAALNREGGGSLPDDTAHNKWFWSFGEFLRLSDRSN